MFSKTLHLLTILYILICSTVVDSANFVTLKGNSLSLTMEQIETVAQGLNSAYFDLLQQMETTPRGRQLNISGAHKMALFFFLYRQLLVLKADHEPFKKLATVDFIYWRNILLHLRQSIKDGSGAFLTLNYEMVKSCRRIINISLSAFFQSADRMNDMGVIYGALSFLIGDDQLPGFLNFVTGLNDAELQKIFIAFDHLLAGALTPEEKNLVQSNSNFSKIYPADLGHYISFRKDDLWIKFVEALLN